MESKHQQAILRAYLDGFHAGAVELANPQHIADRAAAYAADNADPVHAAAPDLLAALEDIASSAPGDYYEEPRAIIDEIIDTANAAVIKARGGK